MSNMDIHPPAQLLDAVVEIAAIQAKLPPSQLSLADSGELHITSTDLPNGSKEYKVWGIIDYLVFVKDSDGRNHVMKYIKANWEDEIYKLQRRFKLSTKDTEAQEYWGSELGFGIASGISIGHSADISINRPLHRTTPTDNTSGQGKASIIPDEIKGWNWGAFLLTFIWGIYHGVWLSLLLFIPIVNFFTVIVFGAKGSEWAWRNKKWDSIEHFKKTQRAWALWGLLFLLIGILVTCLLLFLAYVQDKPKLDEKQVIEMTQEYLISQPGQLYVNRDFTRIIICGRFQGAISGADIEFMEEDEEWFSEPSISWQPQDCPESIYSIRTHVSALRKLAHYDGDGLWAVNICGQWQVDENTGKVIPLDDEAAELLQELSTKTYTNKIYGYYIDYPASWYLDESGETVQISKTLQDYISIGVLPLKPLSATGVKEVTDLLIAGLEEQMLGCTLTSKKQLYSVGDSAWEIVYSCRLDNSFTSISNCRVIAHKGKIYVVTGTAPGSELPSELKSALASFTLIE